MKHCVVRYVYNAPWMYETDTEARIFVGDVIPSDEAIRSAWEIDFESRDDEVNNYQDVIAINPIGDEWEHYAKNYVRPAYVIDVANKRWGRYKDGAIVWETEAWDEAMVFWA